jgi:hypothetical protein
MTSAFSVSRHVRVRVLAGLITVLALAALTPLPCGAGSVDPVRTDNGDRPRDGDQWLELRELWRRGDENDDIFFGLISACVVDDEGLLYLLDSQLSEIHVFSPAGEYLRTIGREGEGPGEFRRASTMTWLPDGSLGVVQRFPGQVVKLTPEGVPAGVILPSDPVTGGRDLMRGAQLSGDGIVFCGAHMTRTEDGRLRRDFLSLYDADGTEKVEYLGKNDEADFSARSFNEIDRDFIGGGRWTVRGDGHVVVAPERDAYTLHVYAPAGELTQLITRIAKPYRRTKEKLDRLESSWKQSRMYQRSQAEQIFAETEPMISALSAGADGELWVLPAEGRFGQPEGILQTWDVLSDEGEWLRRVALAAPGDGERERVILLPDGHVLVVAGCQDAVDAQDGLSTEDVEDEEPAPMEVIMYTTR